MLYCRSGARSQIALQKLKELGLTQVYDLGDYNRAQALVESWQAVSLDGNEVPLGI